MLERAKIRCPICRSSASAVVVWATGDVCPRCGTALTLAKPRVRDAPSSQAEAAKVSGPVAGSSDTVLLRWARAFNARDLEGMLACVAERIDFHPLRLRGMASRYRGRDGVREWFGCLRQARHEHRIAVCEVRDLGAGKVFASGSISLGDEADIGPVCLLHQLEAGVIVNAREYLSDPGTIERLGLIP
ncbi:MAG TPA: nuclear transport factor 2 family protein [Solirubrobacteraceae bacterium]|nr:nuclear transport factor 2 family protein [Solirubrobacteraceae bacterium]